MKIAYIALLMCLVLSTFAAAATSASTTFVAAPRLQTATAPTAPPPCLTTDQINDQIRACEGKGMKASTYVGQDGCKQVYCYEEDTDDCPSYEDLMRMVANCPDNYVSTTDQNGCRVRYCRETPSCPTEEEMDRTVANCPDNYGWTTDQNRCKVKYCLPPPTCPPEDEAMRKVANCPDDYSWTTDQNGCKIPYCIPSTTTCPSEAEAMRKVANCPDAYSWTTDQSGCKVPYCTPTTTCPDNVEEQIKKCKAAKLDYEVYGDQNDCKQVRCRNNEKVECKKYVSDGCVIFTCNDGYVLNLCDYCQPECKVYTDNEGCTVKDCGNGQSSKACPAAVGGVAPAPDMVGELTPVEPQTPEGTAADVAGCVLSSGKDYAKIDDEITWNKCKMKYKLTKPSEDAVSGMLKCAIELKREQGEIDDEITWGKCKEQYLGEETTTGYASPDDKIKNAKQATQLNPQPEPPAPQGLWGWFKGLFK